MRIGSSLGLASLIWASSAGAQPCPRDCEASARDAYGCCPAAVHRRPSSPPPSPPAVYVQPERAAPPPPPAPPPPAHIDCPLPTAPPTQVAFARDDRRSRLQQRAKGLVVTELQGLESLLGATARGDANRVQILRRLAEDYVELENVATKERAQAETDRDALRATDPGASAQKQAVVNQANTVALRAQQRAEQDYTALVTDYPDYPQLDEVLYYLAYEYEQANDLARARQRYFELIQKRPTSKYVPNAYLAFAELFFNEGRTDPAKWNLAQQAYEKVVSFPPPQNHVYGYAWFKLAHVMWWTGEPVQAASAFQRARSWGVSFTQEPGASPVLAAASSDLSQLHRVCPAIPGPDQLPITVAP